MFPWITVGSSWVDAYHYDSGDLYIRFKDHATGGLTACYYAGVSLSMWTDLLTAPSKGKWVHSNLMNPTWPYTIL